MKYSYNRLFLEIKEIVFNLKGMPNLFWIFLGLLYICNHWMISLNSFQILQVALITIQMKMKAWILRGNVC